MATLLLIISRNHPERYAFLKQAFAQNPQVEVVLDRRTRRAKSKGKERRERNNSQLRTHGWVLVRRLPPAAAPPTAITPRTAIARRTVRP
ncbi:MAG: hypothetical protein ACREJ9_10945, partial [Candidatus Rokuibacteriota bacterium]